MTGAILRASSVDQAAKLQIIIMFVIAAAAVLTSVFITFVAIIMVMDQKHRIRNDRNDNKRPVILPGNVGELLATLLGLFNWRTRKP